MKGKRVSSSGRGRPGYRAPSGGAVFRPDTHHNGKYSGISSGIGRTTDEMERRDEIARAIGSDTTATPEMSQEQT